MPMAPKRVRRSYQKDITPFKERAFINPWYKTHRWRKAAAAAKARQPLCLECRVPHELSKYDVVDHTCPVSFGRTEEERELIMWEPTNHKPMCKTAHDKKSARDKNADQQQALRLFYERRGE